MAPAIPTGGKLRAVLMIASASSTPLSSAPPGRVYHFLHVLQRDDHELPVEVVKMSTLFTAVSKVTTRKPSTI
jgi:hypothetical protein